MTSYRFASPPQSSKGVIFRRILDEHFEGIIAHATFNISAGRIEGINNKIKTLRRKGYGYPDDDYFFLKLFDVSRKPYIRNPSSHNVYPLLDISMATRTPRCLNNLYRLVSRSEMMLVFE